MQMIKSKKYFIVGSSVILLCVLSVVGGYYVGHERAIATTAAVVTGRDMLLIKTALEYLESKNVTAAKESLNSMLDELTMELYAYHAGLSDADEKKSSMIILTLIAKYRQEHPFDNEHYPPEFSHKLKEILKEVSGQVTSNERGHP